VISEKLEDIVNNASKYTSEVEQGKRFEFGQNWSRFLTVLDDNRIAVAEQSLKEMLEVNDLLGKSFLDIGSGSGLFSLAARRLGACVHSFDYDPQSVACTAELRRCYFPDDSMWTIEEGSALDTEYLASLGRFDIVYSWGVLHPTGAMWQALENVGLTVAPGGRLFISIYNDQGRASRYWKRIKRTYNRLPRGFKFLILWPVFVRAWGPRICRDLLQGKPFYSWRNYSSARGMSAWRDLVDWVGGYPFEVAKPEEIFEFYYKKGFRPVKLKTCAGSNGCNEYVFINESLDHSHQH
jgi:2-polyprenyl-3-methyl-5-hydroxy-6-metoxy-1,4-benzoquinol methylase